MGTRSGLAYHPSAMVALDSNGPQPIDLLHVVPSAVDAVEELKDFFAREFTRTKALLICACGLLLRPA